MTETKTKYCGADISKEWIDIWSQGRVERIANTARAVRAFLKKLPVGTLVAMEATNDYHLLLADIATELGLTAYVLNPRITHHYQEALALRGTTDALAARTIASFIQHHHPDVRVYVPADPQTKQVRTLLRRRSKLVDVCVQLRQSVSQISSIRKEVEVAIAKLGKAIEKIDTLVDEMMQGNELRERLQTMRGIGPVTSAVIATELEAHDFATSDAFVAFCGLDPRPKESGKHKGKRKLSKRGSRSLRTSLFLAAMSASSTKLWRPYYEKTKAKGLAKLQAILVLARKLARIAWSIQRHNTVFDPARVPTA